MSTQLTAGGGPILLGNYTAVGAVHQNVPLTQLLIGYDMPGYIADMIFPALPVSKESDDYYEFTKSPWFRQEPTLVPDRTPAREIQWQFTKGTYSVDRFALATTISDRERANADSQLRLEETSTQFVKNALQLDNELRVAQLLSVANTSGVTLSGVNQFDNASFTNSGVSIEQRFDTAKEAIRVATGGQDATHVVIPSAVAKVMKRDPEIRELIKYTTNALVNGDLPDTLWGLKVLIPKSIYTASTEGTAEASVTYSDVWGKDIRILYVPPVGGIRIPATGYQFRLNSDNYTVSTWRDDRTKVDGYEVSVSQDLKLTMPTGCYVIGSAIS